MDIKKSLRIAMAQTGITQKEIAESTGTSQPHISRIKTLGSCNTEFLEKLSTAFGMQVSEFIKLGE